MVYRLPYLFLFLEKVIVFIDSLVNSSKIRKSRTYLKKGIDTKGKIYLIKGDIRNIVDIEKVFKLSLKLKKGIESVIHFAGLKSVSESVGNP